MPRSSRGLGRRPFTAVTRVRIPYAVQIQSRKAYVTYRFAAFFVFDIKLNLSLTLSRLFIL